MGDKGFWLAILLGLGAIALTVAAVRYFEQRRIRAMKAAGIALNLEPLAKGERFNFVSVELMRKKRRGIGVVLSGHWQGQPVAVFDLFYPAGKSVSIQTVLMTRFDDVRCPEFAAIEKNANLYRPTVDLPLAEDAPPALAKHWLLYTRDGHWPFGDELTIWMGKGRGRGGWFSSGWSYEGGGSSFYVYRRSTTAKPRELEQWLNEALTEARELAQRVNVAADFGEPEFEPATPERDLFKTKIKFRVEKSFTWGKSKS